MFEVSFDPRRTFHSGGDIDSIWSNGAYCVANVLRIQAACQPDTSPVPDRSDTVVCTQIAEAHANILKSRTLSIAPRYGSVHFELEVQSLDHLNRVLEALRAADLVVSAERA